MQTTGDYSCSSTAPSTRDQFDRHFPVNAGFFGVRRNFSLVYDELYERDSSLATLSGMYTGTGDSLTIDATGALFYQSSVTDCVGNGSASLLYPAFNLYSLKITLESCSGNDAARNGMSYTGLAYLADSGTGASSDVLVLAMSAFVSHVPNEGHTGHFMWTLSVQR